MLSNREETTAVWHFYVDSDNFWRWQKLTDDKQRLESCVSGYGDLEACMADAELHGYRYMASPESTRPARHRKRV